MGTLKSAVFEETGTWTSEPGQTAVMLTMVGGGGGTPGGSEGGGHNGPSGGGGSGELITSMLIPVTPETEYTVTVGVGGIGTTAYVQPIPPTLSSFAGIKALPARGYLNNPFGANNSGAGGGAGGSNGMSTGTFIPGGQLESCHATGGCGGGGGGGQFEASPYFEIAGVNGGVRPTRGLTSGQSYTGPGGGGAGSLWGGTNGADVPDAGVAATSYGAGAGGASAPPTGTFTDGANGGNGVVILMWPSSLP